MRLRIGAAVVVALGLSACSEATSDDPGTVVPDETATYTWHRDIKPIVDRSCIGCHTAGGIGTFSLESYETAKYWQNPIRAAVESKSMPPWMAGEGCAEYEDDLSLSGEEIATFVKWVEEGAPEGDPADAPAPPEGSAGLSRVDVSIPMAESYTPTGSPDDYRCFVLDWNADTAKFVSGFRASPGNPAVVHHVIAFLIVPDLVDEIEAKDAAEPGPGYTCFSGPGVGTGANGFRWVGAWAPGSPGAEFPEGTGIRIEPGSKIALQIHYNTLGGSGSDLTTLDFMTEDAVEREAVVVPFTNFEWVQGNGMEIPAGEESVTHSFPFSASLYVEASTSPPFDTQKPMELHSAALHMHALGDAGRIGIKRTDGGGNECVLDIPKWDFHWQTNYRLKQGKVVQPGDQFTISCTWDNSAGNQMVVDGEKLEPRDVKWGEGTTDEMCLGLLYVTAAAGG